MRKRRENKTERKKKETHGQRGERRPSGQIVKQMGVFLGNQEKSKSNWAVDQPIDPKPNFSPIYLDTH
jgi:hypothetical protein